MEIWRYGATERWRDHPPLPQQRSMAACCGPSSHARESVHTYTGLFFQLQSVGRPNTLYKCCWLHSRNGTVIKVSSGKLQRKVAFFLTTLRLYALLGAWTPRFKGSNRRHVRSAPAQIACHCCASTQSSSWACSPTTANSFKARACVATCSHGSDAVTMQTVHPLYQWPVRCIYDSSAPRPMKSRRDNCCDSCAGLPGETWACLRVGRKQHSLHALNYRTDS